MMDRIAWPIITWLVFFSFVYASEEKRVQVDTNFQTVSTLPDLNYKQTDLRVTDLKYSFFIDGRYTDGAIEQVDFASKRYGAGYQFSKIRTKPTVRVGMVDQRYQGKDTKTVEAWVKGEETIKEKFFYTYSLAYLTFSEQLQTPYTLTELLRGSAVELGGSYAISERWRTTFSVKEFHYNDSNSRRDQDAALFYGIAPGDPWIWAGLGVSHMTNSNDELPYWVPKEFWVIGPRFDIAFTFWDKYFFATGLNLNYFNDVRAGTGTGYYSFSKLKRKMSSSLDLVFTAESIQSEQQGNFWKSSGVGIGLQGKF